MQRRFPGLAIMLLASAAQAQSSIGLADLGIVPAEPVPLAEQMRGCLSDATLCSSAQSSDFTMDSVINLGIIDRGAAPPEPSAPRSLDGSSSARGQATLSHLPSIDISAYLSGDSPAVDGRRQNELAELARLLSSDELAGFDVTLIVQNPAGDDAGARAQEIARVLEQSLAGRVTVVTETADVSGLTLTLAPRG